MKQLLPLLSLSRYGTQSLRTPSQASEIPEQTIKPAATRAHLGSEFVDFRFGLSGAEGAHGHATGKRAGGF